MRSAVQLSENRQAPHSPTTQFAGASSVAEIVGKMMPSKADLKKKARRPKDRPGPHRIIAVGGGKGGSGKSVLVSNLAVAFAQRGFRVIAIDCDLGAANLHTLLGVTNPKTTLTQLFGKDIENLADAVIPTQIPGLQLIAGSGAVPGAANIRHSQKQKLLRHISRLPADVVLLDVGAGTSFNTIDIFNLADLRIVVTTPQLTSIQNAYGFVKASAYRLARSLAETKDERAVFDDESRPDETEVLDDLIARIEPRAPAYAKRIRNRMSNFAACIVGNQLQHAKEVNVLHAITRMIYDFLGLKVPVVSSLSHT
ncbi:MAG: MinD/ParA family protein [Deltaproteobacteria bacterium]|nr:MinD/ParA family protein [Deltaproteobacteria bacterium]